MVQKESMSVEDEYYDRIDHDGTLPSRFRAAVWNDGYRPDNPSTWNVLKKWWYSTVSMSGKDKAEALGESFKTVSNKLSARDNS